MPTRKRKFEAGEYHAITESDQNENRSDQPEPRPNLPRGSSSHFLQAPYISSVLSGQIIYRSSSGLGIGSLPHTRSYISPSEAAVLTLLNSIVSDDLPYPPQEEWLSNLDEGGFLKYSIYSLHTKFSYNVAQLAYIYNILTHDFIPVSYVRLRSFLIRVFAGDRNDTNPQSTYLNQFATFVMKYNPEHSINQQWNFAKNSLDQKLFHLTYPLEVQENLAMKYQALELCSGLSAVALVETVININTFHPNNPENHHPPHLDFSKSLPKIQSLYAAIVRLVKGEGISHVEQFVLSLLNPNVHYNLISTGELNCQDVCERILNYVERYPVLISSFLCHPDFVDKNDRVAFHEPVSFLPGYNKFHSMMIVGARCANGKYYFLCQNWWDHRPFVEVSADYLFSCHANTLRFADDQKEGIHSFRDGLVFTDYSVSITCDGGALSYPPSDELFPQDFL